jgi:Smg protein
MNDNLFEMLMSFFETSLSQITEKKAGSVNNHQDTTAEDESNLDDNHLVIKPAQDQSIRVFTSNEQHKFTKASYQFITRMLLWGVIAPETMEHIIDQLLASESRYVTLGETKWTIRNALAENLDASQLAFLDLVLYQKEDNLPLH